MNAPAWRHSPPASLVMPPWQEIEVQRMNRAAFAAYKKRFVDASRVILAQEQSPVLAEAAFPAYADPNPLISFLFWHRIRTATKFLERRQPPAAVLDFGCGGGVMLPFLGRVAGRVVATDIDLSPLDKMRALLPLPDTIEIVDLKKRGLESLEPKSFDAVLALDVLEHVVDLPGTVSGLCGLLKSGGVLLVSGPTENFFYRIGRKIGGENYTGDYHVRNVYDIRRVLAQYATVRTVATLFYPVPLFKVYCGTVA
ncbi:MAG: methyltransferase domain-containing protein [Planctomycetota bacterium]